MSASRVHKSIKNVKWSFLLQCVTILTKFITTTVFVHVLGISYNGLNGLFGEVIAVLSLAELGVGTAIVYNLYKPLAENDQETLKRLMGLFRSAYHLIALVMLVLGMLLVPFIPLLVKEVPFEDSYIRLIFSLFVVQTASSYLFAYKRSLLNADQRNYIVSLVCIGANIVMMLVCVAVLLLTQNYLLYLLLQIAVHLGTNITVSLIANRKYPFLKRTSKATAEERRQVMTNIKNIFIGTLSGKITSSTDNILISVLVNTYQIGIYANYNLIMNSVMALFRNAAESMTGSFGNLLATEKEQRVDTVFQRASFLFSAFGFGIALILFSVLTPFVQLWIGKDYTISHTVLAICVFNAFLFIAREPLWKTVQTAGLFAVDKNISITGSAVNLVVSIGLGKLWGMAGIFLGTTCTLVIQILLKILLLYRDKLKISPLPCLWGWLRMCLMTVAGMLLLSWVFSFLHPPNTVVEFLIKGIVSAAAGTAAIVLFYGRTDAFKYFFQMAKQLLFKRGERV